LFFVWEACLDHTLVGKCSGFMLNGLLDDHEASERFFCKCSQTLLLQVRG
jgi:hypothetical protein